MTFFVGQKVVCIAGYYNLVRKGSVYTIESIDKDWVAVCGVGNWKYGHPGFESDRFRPLVERKTSISIFKKMLLPTKANETVE